MFEKLKARWNAYQEKVRKHREELRRYTEQYRESMPKETPEERANRKEWEREEWDNYINAETEEEGDAEVIEGEPNPDEED